MGYRITGNTSAEDKLYDFIESESIINYSDLFKRYCQTLQTLIDGDGFIDADILRLFTQEVIQSVYDWKLSENRLTQHPSLFYDWLVYTTQCIFRYQGISEDKDNVLRNMFESMGCSEIRQFLSNYEHLSKVPLLASYMSVNEYYQFRYGRNINTSIHGLGQIPYRALFLLNLSDDNYYEQVVTLVEEYHNKYL